MCQLDDSADLLEAFQVTQGIHVTILKIVNFRMQESLFNSILKCPICTSPLDFALVQHVLLISQAEPVLQCNVCGHTPPYSNGVFVLDKRLTADKGVQGERNYNKIWAQFDKYDASTSAYRIEKRIISSFKESFKGKLVLDAGVGDGRHLDLLLQAQPSGVICVDAHDVIYRARKRANKANSSVPILFIKADLHEEIFADNSFDTTWSAGVLTVVSSPRTVAWNLARATKHHLFVAILSDNIFGKIYLRINILRPLFRLFAQCKVLPILTLPGSLLFYVFFKCLPLAKKNNDLVANLNKLAFLQAISHIEGLLQEPLLVKGLQNIDSNILSNWLDQHFARNHNLGQELFLKYLVFER